MQNERFMHDTILPYLPIVYLPDEARYGRGTLVRIGKRLDKPDFTVLYVFGIKPVAFHFTAVDKEWSGQGK